MRRGFTLVELSIVLVIIGLLVGGVLTGQSLIRASELRTVSRDLGKYQSAIFTFRDKYAGLPGDITDAVTYWGQDSASSCTDAPVAGDRVAKIVTCNGNGDGLLGSPLNNEFFRAWQQLADAGLIEGSYTGVAGPLTSRQTVLDSNVPRSRVTNAGFSFYQASYPPNYPGRWDVASGKNLIEFGATCNSCGGYETFWSVIKPEEAWNIDTKMDDGLPGVGSLTSWKGACVSTTDPGTAVYVLSDTGLDCNFDFILGL